MLQAIMAGNNLTYGTVIDFIKLINLIIGEKKIPESKYHFNKVCTESIKYSKNYFCTNCYESYDTKRCKNDVCLKCDGTVDYFITSPIKENLSQIITKNYASILSYKEYLQNCDPSEISDVNNAAWYKSLDIEGDFITININTDGVAPFNSSKKLSLWPILMTINDLRPTERFDKKNILSAGYWMSVVQPKMEIFLKPFIEEMNFLYNNGITVCGKNYKVVVCSCCLDSVARAKCLCIKQFNGSFGCTFCLHPMINKRYPSFQAENRTLDHYLKSIGKWNNLTDLQKQKGEAIYGIKGKSPLLDIQNFNPMVQVPVDFMHCVLLGVTKTLLGLWLTSKYHDKPFYIDNSKKKELDKKFKAIKTYSECSRKSDSLLKYHTFKANEFFNFLFYYSKDCLSGNILEPKYYQHFLLFSDSIEALYSNKFTIIELDCIKNKLAKFVFDFEQLYGTNHMYYNVHLLLHLADTSKMFGPLFTTSLFAFENMNGVLNNFLKGPKGSSLQICIKHYLYFNNYYHETNRLTEKAASFCKTILRKSNKKYKYTNVGRRFIRYELPVEIINPFNETKIFKSYKKFFLKNTIISTFEHSTRSKMYNDSFILFEDSFYRIDKILKCFDDNDNFTYILGKQIIVNTYPWIQNYHEVTGIDSSQLIKIDKQFLKCIHFLSNDIECLIVIKNKLHVD